MGKVIAPRLISPSYRALLRRKHRNDKWGNSGKFYLGEVLKYRDELGARTILDYGCGRGSLAKVMKEADPNQRVFEYDPGVLAKSSPPRSADLVVCTDVLEHVEPATLDAVLSHLRRLAIKGLFLFIAKGPANAFLPDGRNAHLIQQDAEWWINKLKSAGYQIDRFEDAKGISVWVKK